MQLAVLVLTEPDELHTEWAVAELDDPVWAGLGAGGGEEPAVGVVQPP